MSFPHQCHLTKTFRPPTTDQVRLGVLSQTKLITGEELYDTAYALGLTSYTREELIPRVDGVNQPWRLLLLEMEGLLSGMRLGV